MKIDSFSIEGKHNSNEDSLSVLQIIDDKIIAVLADGMGSLTFGKEAADLIVSTIITFVCEHINKMTVSDLLIKALEFADKAVSKKSLEMHSKMGAAVAVAFIEDRDIHYTWLGNVRIYISDHDEMKQLSTDHTLNIGYGKYLLTRCIKGAGLRDDIPYQCQKANAGSSLFLCTDGLYKQVKVNQMLDKALPTNEEYEDDATLIRIVL